MFKFRNHLAAVFLLLSMATATAQTQSLPRVTLMFKNGQSIRLCLPSRNWKPSLPCSLADPATQELAQYPDTVISSISLDAGESPINGCSRWEACHIATPSLIFGKEHTELRLIGVVATSAGRGTVYRWFLNSLSLYTRRTTVAARPSYGIRENPSRICQCRKKLLSKRETKRKRITHQTSFGKPCRHCAPLLITHIFHEKNLQHHPL